MDEKVPRLFRILFEVSELDRAIAFYSALLDTAGRPIRGGRYYYDCGPVILGLVDVSGEGRSARPTPEYVYLAVADLDEVHRRATALGCLSRDVVHGASAGEVAERPWGERSFYVEDPFGNLLCFVDDRTLFTGR